MTDETKLMKDADRGRRAQEILDNELVKDAFEEINRALYASFQRSEADDKAGRERIYLSMRLLERFKLSFETAVRSGKAAETELLRIKDPNAFEKLMEKMNG